MLLILVDGYWGEWGHYGDCSAQCGAGTKSRKRYCNNPAPSYGGNQCTGYDTDSKPCTGYHCAGKYMT